MTNQNDVTNWTTEQIRNAPESFWDVEVWPISKEGSYTYGSLDHARRHQILAKFAYPIHQRVLDLEKRLVLAERLLNEARRAGTER